MTDPCFLCDPDSLGIPCTHLPADVQPEPCEDCGAPDHVSCYEDQRAERALALFMQIQPVFKKSEGEAA